jgi:choline dehydrogenase-like flavoprotein
MAEARLVAAWEYLGDPSQGDGAAAGVLIYRDAEILQAAGARRSEGGPFPTGTGINPTLTIMANAWRVADHIADASGTAG